MRVCARVFVRAARFPRADRPTGVTALCSRPPCHQRARSRLRHAHARAHGVQLVALVTNGVVNVAIPLFFVALALARSRQQMDGGHTAMWTKENQGTYRFMFRG